jgi:MFS family permease
MAPSTVTDPTPTRPAEPIRQPSRRWSRSRAAATVQNPGRAALEKRLRPLYLTSFLQGFALWYAVEKLFMRSIGLSDALIAISTSIYFVVMMVANVPIGVLADRWSRKGVLHLATIALIGTSVVCGLAHSFLVYTIGTSIWALFYACYSGTYDAIVYDVALEETGSAEGFERHYGRAQMAEFLGILGGALTSVLVVQLWTIRATFFLTVPITCCAFLTLHAFKEPLLHKARNEPLSAHLGQIVQAFLSNWTVARIVICMVCAAQIMRLLFEFSQLWYLALGLPKYFYGPFDALLLSGAVAGGYLASKLPVGRLAVLATAIFTLAISSGLFVKLAPAVIAAQSLTMAGIVILTVTLSRYLHNEMPSTIRTGASSVAAGAGYGVFVPVAITFGLTSQHQGIFHASWFVTGALILLSAGLITLLVRARRADNDSTSAVGNGRHPFMPAVVEVGDQGEDVR